MTEDQPTAEAGSFESALAELETIVAGLERGTLGLEESIVAFERGMKLLGYLHHRLEDAEKRVKLLLESEGSLVERPARRAEPS
jgi:exodeoxyribonuclease VII small subunit